MNTTITIKEMIVILLGGAGFALIISLVVLTANLIKTVKRANVIMADAEKVTKIVSKRSEEVDGVLDDVFKSVKAVAKNLKGEVNLLKIGSSIVGLVTAITGVVKAKNSSQQKPGATRKSSSGKSTGAADKKGAVKATRKTADKKEE